jgi:cytochrome c-type biogenesis protein CcmF
MPWLAGTALLHSAIVMEKREALKVWTILLAILTFSLSLLGAFLVRSGVLSSVHAFAVDPERGVFILCIMLIFVGGSLTLFAYRMGSLRQGGLFAPISREGGLVLNNVLLTTACATVLIGTLFPLVADAFNGSKISVGAPFFNATFVPLMIPLLIAMPLGPAMAWKRGDLAAALQRLMAAMIIAIITVVAVFAVAYRGPWLAPIAIGIGVWVMAGAIQDLISRSRFGEVEWAVAWSRLKGLPRGAFGTASAHFGVGLMVVGIAATSAYRIEQNLVMKPGQTLDFAGYKLTFEGVAPAQGPNYAESQGIFKVESGSEVTRLTPAKRVYRASRQTTTEAGIKATFAGDLYVVLGDAQSAGAYAIKVYFHPLVRYIWIGAVIMFIGGILSLSDRKLRIGAPRRAEGQRGGSKGTGDAQTA